MRGPPRLLTWGAGAAEVRWILDTVQGTLDNLLGLLQGALQEGKLLVLELLLSASLLWAEREKLKPLPSTAGWEHSGQASVTCI